MLIQWVKLFYLGIWVFKGQELAFELCEDWQIDYSSYAWEKLDPATDNTKVCMIYNLYISTYTHSIDLNIQSYLYFF